MFYFFVQYWVIFQLFAEQKNTNLSIWTSSWQKVATSNTCRCKLRELRVQVPHVPPPSLPLHACGCIVTSGYSKKGVGLKEGGLNPLPKIFLRPNPSKKILASCKSSTGIRFCLCRIQQAQGSFQLFLFPKCWKRPHPHPTFYFPVANSFWELLNKFRVTS